MQEKQKEKNIEININNIIQYLFNVLMESNFNILEDLNKFDETEIFTSYGRPQKKLGLKN